MKLVSGEKAARFEGFGLCDAMRTLVAKSVPMESCKPKTPGVRTINLRVRHCSVPEIYHLHKTENHSDAILRKQLSLNHLQVSFRIWFRKAPSRNLYLHPFAIHEKLRTHSTEHGNSMRNRWCGLKPCASTTTGLCHLEHPKAPKPGHIRWFLL